MSTFVTLPRCLLSSPLSYGPYLLSIGTGGGGRAEGEGLQFCRHLCMAPLSVFHVLSRALRPHEELSRVFPRTSFPLFYIFMVFVLSPLPPPHHHPRSVKWPELGTSKASVFTKTNLALPECCLWAFRSPCVPSWHAQLHPLIIITVLQHWAQCGSCQYSLAKPPKPDLENQSMATVTWITQGAPWVGWEILLENAYKRKKATSYLLNF